CAGRRDRLCGALRSLALCDRGRAAVGQRCPRETGRRTPTRVAGARARRTRRVARPAPDGIEAAPKGPVTSPTPMTILCDLLGIDVPLVQAPMAGAQAGAMAAATAEAGALGSLPCARLSTEAMVKELELIRGRTRNPLNVNFFVHVAPAVDAQREAT